MSFFSLPALQTSFMSCNKIYFFVVFLYLWYKSASIVLMSLLVSVLLMRWRTLLLRCWCLLGTFHYSCLQTDSENDVHQRKIVSITWALCMIGTWYSSHYRVLMDIEVLISGQKKSYQELNKDPVNKTKTTSSPFCLS